MKYKKKEFLKAIEDGTLEFQWNEDNVEIVDELGNVYERYQQWDIEQLIQANIDEYARQDMVYKIIDDA